MAFLIFSTFVFGAAADAVASGNSAKMPTIRELTLVGTWWGINGTPGRLVLKANHSYTYSVAGGHGAWRATPGGAVFTGTLGAWNHGRASTKRGVLEFSWTRANGAKNWFVFQKVR
jgi:hypothetical protein